MFYVIYCRRLPKKNAPGFAILFSYYMAHFSNGQFFISFPGELVKGTEDCSKIHKFIDIFKHANVTGGIFSYTYKSFKNVSSCFINALKGQKKYIFMNELWTSHYSNSKRRPGQVSDHAKQINFYQDSEGLIKKAAQSFSFGRFDSSLLSKKLQVVAIGSSNYNTGAFIDIPPKMGEFDAFFFEKEFFDSCDCKPQDFIKKAVDEYMNLEDDEKNSIIKQFFITESIHDDSRSLEDIFGIPELIV